MVKSNKKLFILIGFYFRLTSKTLIRLITNFLIISIAGVILLNLREKIYALWLFMGFAAALIFPFDVIDVDEDVRIKKSLRTLPINSTIVFYSKYFLSVLMLIIYYSISVLMVFLIRVEGFQILDIDMACTFFIGLLCFLTFIFIVRINTTQIKFALIIIAVLLIVVITIGSLVLNRTDINVISLFMFIQKNRIQKWMVFGALPFIVVLNALGELMYGRSRSYKELR